MPYKRARKSYRRRYVPRKRTRYTKRRTSVVKRIIGRLAEKKRNILEQTSTDVAYPATLTDLSIVPKELAADDSSDLKREGDKLTITSLDFVAHVISGGDASNLMRLIIFKWKPNNATAPTVADILKDASGTSIDTIRRYNEDTSSQYKIVMDRTVTITTNGSNRTVAFKRKLYGAALGSNKLVFNSNDGTTGEGKYYLLSISDSGSAPHPKLAFIARSEYYDF